MTLGQKKPGSSRGQLQKKSHPVNPDMVNRGVCSIGEG